MPMREWLASWGTGGAVAVAVAAALLIVLAAALAVLLWRRRDPRRRLDRALAAISHDMLTDIVLPKADEGEIHIGHVLLTERGLLVIDLKEVEGVVFGGDRMHEWTVIDGERRRTFANPQATLYDRVAAVKQIAREVPVEGRIVFTARARFTKGVPSGVVQLDDLEAQLPVVSRVSPTDSVRAFQPHWARLREAAAGRSVLHSPS